MDRSKADCRRADLARTIGRREFPPRSASSANATKSGPMARGNGSKNNTPYSAIPSITASNVRFLCRKRRCSPRQSRIGTAETVFNRGKKSLQGRNS
jgi:hypothetical protein